MRTCRAILPAIRRRTITYGASAQADMEASEIGCGTSRSDFSLRYRGCRPGPLPSARPRPPQRAERHGRGRASRWNWK